MSSNEEKISTKSSENSLDKTKKDETIPPGLKKSGLREYFESAIVTVIMALFGMTFIVQAVKVPTGSMLNTILVGDHLLVNKFIFGSNSFFMDKILPHRPIRRGDIIVFKFPGDPSTNYVKRVIGLPGETVEVKGTHVYINGQELPEQRLTANIPDPNNNEAPLEVLNKGEAPAGATYKVYYTAESDDATFDPVEKRLLGQKYAVGTPYTVPANCYFAMGDNRDNSQDSRYWGFVPRENIVGRALVVYWSLDLTQKPDQPPDSLLNTFTQKTRWNRIGTLIN